MIAFAAAAGVATTVVFRFFLIGKSGKAALSILWNETDEVYLNTLLISMFSAAAVAGVLWPRYKSEKSVSNGALSTVIVIASYPLMLYCINVAQHGLSLTFEEFRNLLIGSGAAFAFTFWLTIPCALVAGAAVCALQRKSGRSNDISSNENTTGDR